MPGRITDHELPGSAVAEDRPLLGWGQLLLPPFAAGMCWVLLACTFEVGPCCLAVFLLLSIPLIPSWAWKVCNQIAEWRFTVCWEASLKGEQSRPDDGFVSRLQGTLFALELVAFLLTFFWAAGTLAILDHFGLRPKGVPW